MNCIDKLVRVRIRRLVQELVVTVKEKFNCLFDLAYLGTLIDRREPLHESWNDELRIISLGHGSLVVEFISVVDSELSSEDRSRTIAKLFHRVFLRTIDLAAATHIPARRTTTSTSRHDNCKRKNQKEETWKGPTDIKAVRIQNDM